LGRLVLNAAALGLGVWLLWKYAELVGEVGPEPARAVVLRSRRALSHKYWLEMSR
jgi:hypothetical protein